MRWYERYQAYSISLLHNIQLESPQIKCRSAFIFSMRVNRTLCLSDVQVKRLCTVTKYFLNTVVAMEYTFLISFLFKKSWEEYSWLTASNCYTLRFIMTSMHTSCFPRAIHSVYNRWGSRLGPFLPHVELFDEWALHVDTSTVWATFLDQCCIWRPFLQHPFPPFGLSQWQTCTAARGLPHGLLLTSSFILRGHFPINLLYA